MLRKVKGTVRLFMTVRDVWFSRVLICSLHLFVAKIRSVEISNKLHYCIRDQRSFRLGTQRPYTVHKSSLFDISTLLKLRGFSKRATAIQV
jgi:hypothetical protein